MDEPEKLRNWAEKFLEARSEDVHDISDLSPDDLKKMIHELRVHQIELDIQNEELRQMQSELETAQAEYSELYEFAPTGYFTFDRRSFIRQVNLAGTRLLSNRPRSFLVNTPFSKFVHPDDVRTFLLHLRQVFDDGDRQVCEIRLNINSEHKFVRLESAPARDSDGHVTDCRTIATDLTDRKRSEQALEQSEQRFRSIFEGAEDCIFLKDRSLRYVQVNPAFENLIGVRASEIIGKRHEDLFPEDAPDRVRGIELRVLEGEAIEDEDTLIVRSAPMKFLATRTPLRGTLNEVTGISTILHDITDRKRAEVPIPPMKAEYVSEAMQATLNQAKVAAKGVSTILLIGESGSGKDYLANYIHEHSNQANGPYFSVNCAAIASELAESELFGHEKGAFTGALGRKRGLLELAEGGTLLLNEIGDLPLRLQAKLLTFLDTKTFTRVGGEKEIPVSARLIAATNRDLKKAVEEGDFRKDLFYRLNVVSIPVPPLRDRRDDIPILVQEILHTIRSEMQIHKMPILSPSAIDELKKYRWPGNVRELRNVLERAVMLSSGKEIDPSHLGLTEGRGLLPGNQGVSFTVSFPNSQSLNEMTRELKRFMVIEALRLSEGSRVEAARLLGISRYSLKHYMNTLGCDEEETQE
ncbi:sigma 54-interacting transcriptional regulator [Desulfomonile tiedjei]|uniref:Transcriptional regulator containing PAS, AAA-type ATPase, and DNA-binding domains n=1 Tax=Desulfomonile tiedjei (strain ATCC 49306 / DSM 6799 / DCB-1) TaxID=706587 RepID=I4C578_DESTA|nr:sigma 54-interacting transcriptional regulator [Desulfomonile tiedjei]AFM24719.1 transcriptional regulator containing PAS, AAA-type ATPase, and DNA-binding domains [Desulfomonile tiedjei DSM 6799]